MSPHVIIMLVLAILVAVMFVLLRTPSARIDGNHNPVPVSLENSAERLPESIMIRLLEADAIIERVETGEAEVVALDDALASYSKCQQQVGHTHTEIVRRIARAHFVGGEWFLAEQRFAELLESLPKKSTEHSECYVLYARILEYLQKWEDADRAYRQCIDIVPSDEVFVRYGVLLEKQNKSDQANKLFRMVTKKREDEHLPETLSSVWQDIAQEEIYMTDRNEASVTRV